MKRWLRVDYFQDWKYPLRFRHIFLENSDLSVVHAPVCSRRERKLQSHEHSIFLMPTKIPRSRTILKNGWGWRTTVFRRTALFTNVTDFCFMYIHSCKKSRVVWQMSYGYRGNNDRVNSNNLSLPHQKVGQTVKKRSNSEFVFWSGEQIH